MTKLAKKITTGGFAVALCILGGSSALAQNKSSVKPQRVPEGNRSQNTTDQRSPVLTATTNPAPASITRPPPTFTPVPAPSPTPTTPTPPPSSLPTLACPMGSGPAPQLNISTGVVTWMSVPPHPYSNGAPATNIPYYNAAYPLVPGATWVRPDWGSGYSGFYPNTVKFDVATCPSAPQPKLIIRYLADNNAVLLLDNVQVAQQPVNIYDGWMLKNMVSVVIPVTPGQHTLTLKLKQIIGESAFVAHAVLMR